MNSFEKEDDNLLKAAVTGESKKSKSKSLDEILYELKPYGYYQLFMHLFQVYGGIISAGSLIGGFFSLGGLKPDYACGDIEQPDWNSTCHMMRTCHNLSTVTQFHSLYEEFEWECEPSYIVAGFTTLVTVVSLVGYLFGGMWPDMLGRKPIMVLGLIIMMVGLFVMAISPSWQMYMGAFLLQAIASTLYISSAYALTQETVCVKYRMLQGFSFQWIVGHIVAAYLAYLAGEWRRFLWVLLGLTSLGTMVMACFMCESPRWLLQRGRVSQARKSLNYMARFNRVTIRYTDEEVRTIDIGAEHDTKRFEHPLRVFGSRKFLLYAIPLSLVSVVCRQIYHIVLMDITNLAGSPFVNIAMLGALRIWIPPVAIGLEQNIVSCGRKSLIVVAQVMCAVCFIMMVCVRQLAMFASLQWMGTLSTLTGYAFSGGLLWSTYNQLISELYPTETRANALSVYSLIACLGNILAAQLVYLAEYWSPMPYAVTVVECIISAVLCALILPETKNKPLKDTLEQLEEEDNN